MSKLRSLGVSLAVIAYAKWNFRVLGVSMEFLKSRPFFGGDIYAVPPLYAEVNPGARRKLIKPLYGRSADCKE